MLRVFVAAYPPTAWTELLAARMREADLPAHAPTAMDQVHLTVQFVGPVAPRKVSDLVESVRWACRGLRSFELEGRRIVRLPARAERARLLALETTVPASLLELKRRLVQRLACHARPEAADRFLPHLTVTRFRGGGAVIDARELRRRGVEVDPGELEPWVVDEIRVMRSRLTQGGAIHEPIEVVALRG